MAMARKSMGRAFALFNELIGRPIDMKVYTHRLIIQKLTYLVQRHLKESFWYGWYVRGPYSPSVSSQAFELFEAGKTNFELNPEDSNILAALKSLLIEDAKDSELQIDEKLELFASLLFIKRERNIDFGKENELVEALYRLKPWFEKEQIKKAIENLKKSSFV